MGADFKCCKQPFTNSFDVDIQGRLDHPSSTIQLRKPTPNYLAFAKVISNVNLLSQIDGYIASSRVGQSLSRQIVNHQGLKDMLSNQQQTQQVCIIASKTYNLCQNRYNSIDNLANNYQVCLLQLYAHVGETIQQIENSSRHFRKIKLLQQSLHEQQATQQQQIEAVFKQLTSQPGMQDHVWDISKKQTVQTMSAHLLYNINKYIHFVNTQFSLNDYCSLVSARKLFHFFRKHICTQQLQQLANIYYIDIDCHPAQQLLFQIGCVVFFPGFVPLEVLKENTKEPEQNKTAQDGYEKKKIRMRIKWLEQNETKCKFRHRQHLYYLPFSLFVVQQVIHKEWGLQVRIMQMEEQYLITYLQQAATHSNNKTENNEANISEQLQVFRQSTSDMIEEGLLVEESQQQKPNNSSSRIKYKQAAKEYYRQYTQNIKIANARNSANSIKAANVQDKPVQQAIQEQQDPIVEDSPIKIVELSADKEKTLQKKLQKYIQKMELQKLTDQLDNVDSFWKITVLNLSTFVINRQQLVVENIVHGLLPQPSRTLSVQLCPHVDSNKIHKIEGLQANTSLRVLSLSRNQIALVENMQHLRDLKELYLTKNQLDDKSASSLSACGLQKLRILAISFKLNPDSCFQILFKKPAKLLRKVIINDGDKLSLRTKRSLPRWLHKKTKLQIFTN